MSLLSSLFLLAAAPFAAPALPDDQLAEHRGGFRLPSGIDVAMTIDTQTAVDGAVVLRTILRLDQGAPQLAVYVPRAGETVSAGPTARAGMGVTTNPVVSFDRMNGIQISGNVNASPLAMTGGAGAASIPAGLEAVSAKDGVATAAGTVVDRFAGAQRIVELTGQDLSVLHLAGGAFGSAIANTGNDRVIDTQTTLSIDLSNAGPDVLGSSMLRAQDISADALRGRL